MPTKTSTTKSVSELCICRLFLSGEERVFLIWIAEIGNAWSRILKNGVELTRVYEQNLMNAQKPTEWFFEMSTDGLIRVFSSHNKYMPLMTAIAKPIDVQYISLASQSRIEFFYEVNEDPKPSMPLTHIPASADSNYKNPLLNVVDYPLGLTDLCKYLRNT